MLTREDWISAALDALLGEGIEAVRVLKLAGRLGVTRGSFYWHFKSREALLDAVLQEWQARNTGIMLEVLKQATDLETGILNLFSVWVDHSKFDASLDQAVRDWGRRSETVGEIVAQEDTARVSAIAAFFERQGFDRIEAFVRARVIYFTQISYFALGVKEPMDQRMEYLSAYFKAFTGQEIDPDTARSFSERLLRGAGS